MTQTGSEDVIAQPDAASDASVDTAADATADLPCTACGGGCFVLANDPLNCGSCGNVCVPPENATATCNAGVCGFTCATGFDECSNRCFRTDNNLSFCGQACVDCAALPHVDLDIVGCSHGACTLLNACAPNWADCDGVSSNGCETDLTNVNSCGACSAHCASGMPRCTADPTFGGYVCSN